MVFKYRAAIRLHDWQPATCARRMAALPPPRWQRDGGILIYGAAQHTEKYTMSSRDQSSRLYRAFQLFADAAAVSAAVDARRQPPAGALTRLGIDPEAFGRIRRF